MEGQLFEWIGQFSYPAVYLFLAATGVGAPLSEDVILLSAGMVVAAGRAWLWGMVAVACVGVITADTLLFRIGAGLGPRVIEHKKFKRVLTERRVAWARGMFERYGAWTVFAARFVPGLRVPSFVLAGSFGVTQRKFWLADGLAVAIFAPSVLLVGYTFGAAALPYLRAFGGWALLGAAVAAATAWLVIGARRRRAA